MGRSTPTAHYCAAARGTQSEPLSPIAFRVLSFSASASLRWTLVAP